MASSNERHSQIERRLTELRNPASRNLDRMTALQIGARWTVRIARSRRPANCPRLPVLYGIVARMQAGGRLIDEGVGSNADRRRRRSRNAHRRWNFALGASLNRRRQESNDGALWKAWKTANQTRCGSETAQVQSSRYRGRHRCQRVNSIRFGGRGLRQKRKALTVGISANRNSLLEKRRRSPSPARSAGSVDRFYASESGYSQKRRRHALYRGDGAARSRLRQLDDRSRADNQKLRHRVKRI